MTTGSLSRPCAWSGRSRAQSAGEPNGKGFWKSCTFGLLTYTRTSCQTCVKLRGVWLHLSLIHYKWQDCHAQKDTSYIDPLQNKVKKKFT